MGEIETTEQIGQTAGMKRGLTLGRFAPLHEGHQLLIETTLSETDDVPVIAYDCPEEGALDVRFSTTRWLFVPLLVCILLAVATGAFMSRVRFSPLSYWRWPRIPTSTRSRPS